jgi:hypothetical protein
VRSPAGTPPLRSLLRIHCPSTVGSHAPALGIAYPPAMCTVHDLVTVVVTFPTFSEADTDAV